jgi:hypothetical protein
VLKFLVKRFADSVAAQAAEIEQGDPTSGNRSAKRYLAALDELRTHGDSGREALCALLTDSRAEVRVAAAGFLLRYCEERARPILEIEAMPEKRGLSAFRAERLLKAWEDGTWKLDPL